MKRFAFIFLLVNVLLAALLLGLVLWGDDGEQPYLQCSIQTDTVTVAENRECLKCHAHRRFEMAKPSRPNKMYRMKMPMDYIIDSAKYLCSSHWEFKCTDCHSTDYKTVPHDQSLRFETLSTCNDCHGGGDTAWTRYGFDTIAVDFEQSVHKDLRANCYACHDPHYTKLCVRNDSMSMKEVVATSNGMCIKCHPLSNDSMVQAHDMFPHTDLHFDKTRCIDCHARPNSATLVDHNILPSEESVHDCAKCHSQNSAVIQNLHAQRSLETDQQSSLAGYFRSKFLTNSIYLVAGFSVLLIVGHFAGLFTRKKP